MNHAKLFHENYIKMRKKKELTTDENYFLSMTRFPGTGGVECPGSCSCGDGCCAWRASPREQSRCLLNRYGVDWKNMLPAYYNKAGTYVWPSDNWLCVEKLKLARRDYALSIKRRQI